MPKIKTMNWDNYMLRVERHSHHHRDDWGMEYDSYDYYDADLKDIAEGQMISPLEFVAEGRPLRSDPHIKLRCDAVDDDSITFTFFFLENYKGTTITVKPDEPAYAGGSSDRHSASYTISLIPKSKHLPKKGDISYI